jgi:glutathione S-transferase
MELEMLKLYHHPASVTSAKVRLVLAEKNIPWAGQVIDLYQGEQFQPWYLALNPAAAVPTVEVDGRTVRESVAICEYLEEAFPGNSLVPSNYADRARMRVWCKDVETFMSVAAAGVIFPANDRFELESLSASQLTDYYSHHPNARMAERKRQWMVEGFASKSAQQAVLTYNKFLYKLELQLAETPWLVGEGYTLADAAASPYIGLLELLGFSEWIKRMPHVVKWFEQVSQRPAFVTAVYAAIPKDLRERMRTRGEHTWAEVDAVLSTAEPFTGRSPWAMRADAI